MNLQEFEESLQHDTPPDLSKPLQALWHDANDDWNLAHRIVQKLENQNAFWVHAYLHHVEGDVGNAGYWYNRAGQPHSRAPVDEEWRQIAAALLEFEP